MLALSHDAVRIRSPLSALKRSPGFWFLVAGAADAAIVLGGFTGLALLGALAAACAFLWPTLQKALRSW
jgi:hypothetical protein